MPAAADLIEIRHVLRVLEGARRKGCDVDAICRRAGMSPDLLVTSGATVTAREFARLIRALTRSLRDEFWGTLSSPVRIGTFAAMCRGLVHCETLEEAIRVGIRHYRIAQRDFVPRLESRDGTSRLWLQERFDSPPDEFSIARGGFVLFAYGLCCWLVGRRIPLTRVVFRHAAPGSHREAAALFPAPVIFGGCFSGFELSSEWMRCSLSLSGRAVEAFLAEFPFNVVVRYRDRHSAVEIVRSGLRHSLADDIPFERMAARIGVGTKTLSRRLKDEGKTYRMLKEELRRDAAIEYLTRTDLTVEQIGARVGFSEVSAFHRAFKGWTGVAPGAYRAELSAGGRTPGRLPWSHRLKPVLHRDPGVESGRIARSG